MLDLIVASGGRSSGARFRVPLGEAAPLFRHWIDLSNAERMNHWLSILAENNVLLSSALQSWPPRNARRG